MNVAFAIIPTVVAVLLAGPSFAQNTSDQGSIPGVDEVGEFRDVYVDGEGDSVMLQGGAFGTAGSRVLGDTTYARPADCPEGSFYWSGQDELTACAGAASFDVVRTLRLRVQ